MTIRLELANGNCEIFETDNYTISSLNDMHPMICKVDVFSNGKKIKTKKRFCVWWYKLITFKSQKVQEKLKKINEIKLNEDKDKSNS